MKNTHTFLKRIVLLGCGWLCVVLGVIGIFLPVMPTTPFLLLAAACFMRSSPPIYDWLTQHPRLGPYLVHYLEGKGLPMKAKVYTLLLMWCSISFSLLIIPLFWPRIGLLMIALLVSGYIVHLPTRENELD